MRRVAIKKAQVKLVHRFDVMAQIAIVAAHRHEVCQRFGQLHFIGNLVGRVTRVHQAHSLVVRIFVHIAVHGDELLDVRIPPYRPVVRGDIHLGLAGLLQGLLHVGGPAQSIAHFGAADGQQVMHGLRQVFCAVIQLFGWNRKAQFGRAFGIGDVMKHKVHTIDLHRLIGLVNQPGRRQDSDAAVDHIFAQTGVDIAFSAARQVASKLVHRASAHGAAHEYVLAGSLFHKSCRRHDGHLALRRILLRQNA